MRACVRACVYIKYICIIHTVCVYCMHQIHSLLAILPPSNQTDTKIMIRGKGSVKENKLGKGAQPMPGEDEPLHALIIATSPEALKRGVDKVRVRATYV